MQFGLEAEQVAAAITNQRSAAGAKTMYACVRVCTYVHVCICACVLTLAPAVQYIQLLRRGIVLPHPNCNLVSPFWDELLPFLRPKTPLATGIPHDKGACTKAASHQEIESLPLAHSIFILLGETRIKAFVAQKPCHAVREGQNAMQ